MREYLLTLDDSGKYVIKTLHGFNTLIKPSDVECIISGLKEYCKNYTDDEIDVINTNIKDHFFDGNSDTKKVHSQKRPSGYIYLLKCGEFYKIGYSKCVEQRISQLDTRPYKIELLNSFESDFAYPIEQELHKIYKMYQVSNEWYSPELPIDAVYETIKELEGNYEI